MKLQARAERRRLVRQRWRVVGVAVVGYCVIAAAVLVFQPPATMEFWFGAATVGLGWLLTEVVRAVSAATTPLWRGAEGEEFTAQELRKLRRSSRWYIIDGVEFSGLDVDHVAIGPGGVFAVESKYSSAEVDLRDVPPWFSAFSQQAQSNARKIRGLISRHARVDVRPVVVLWGPRVRNVPRGHATHGQVLYCVGRQGRLWRSALGGEVLSLGEIEGAREAVQEFVESRHRWNANNPRATG